MQRFPFLPAALCAATALFLTSLTGAQSSWTLLAPGGAIPPLRNYGASTVFDAANDRLILFGGNVGGVTNEVRILTNATGAGAKTWLLLPTAGAMPSGRSNHSAVYDAASNRMIVFGGCEGGCLPTTNTAYVLSNANGLGGTAVWTQLAAAGPPSPRQNAAAAYDALTNQLIVFGGQDGGGSPASSFDDTWLLRNANGLGGPPQWVPVNAAGPRPAGRYAPSGAFDPVNGRLIITGGIQTSGATTNGTWTLTGVTSGTGVWASVIPHGAAGNPPPFGNIRGGYDAATGRFFLPMPTSATHEVWVLENAASWLRLSPASGPSTALHAMGTIYHPAANVLLGFFTGNAPGLVNQLWSIKPDVNSAPQFMAPTPADGASFTLRAGQQFQQNLAASDSNAGDTVTIDFTSLPPGVQTGTDGPANPVNRDLSWRPSFSQTGAHTFTFTAQDNQGLSVTRSFTVNVTPNTSPTFVAPTPFAPVNGKEGRPVAFDVTASDADSDDGFTVDVDLATLPPGAQSFAGNFGNPASRTFQWTPGLGQAGTHVVRFSVTDLAGEIRTHDVTIIVAPNSAPIFVPPTPFAPVTAQAGRLVTFSVQAFDADADDPPSLFVDFSTVPAGVLVSGGGASRFFSWTPGLMQTGMFVVKVSASDLAGAHTEHSVTLNITPNNPPIFIPPTPFAPFNVQVGTPVGFTVTASDPDPDESFTVDVDFSTLPPGANSGGTGSGNPAGRTFNWTPGPMNTGPFAVKFSATDRAGARTEHTVTINVTPNNPPFFVPPTPFGPLSVNAGSQVQFTLKAQDPDGHTTQIFTDFGSLPSGVNVGPSPSGNPVEVTVTWTPNANQAGTHTLNFSARDQFFAETPHSVTITVAPVTLVSIAVTPPGTSMHSGQRSFTATGTFSDGSTKTLQSGSGGQGSAPLWQTFFSPGIDVSPCGAAASFSSQAFSVQGNEVHQIWSPLTPVLKVDGTINPASLSFALACTNGNAAGTLTATWNGTRYTGTYSLGGSNGQVMITGWSTKAPMPAPRFGFGAATSNGRVYAIGGVSGFNVLDRVEEYDPAVNSWSGNLAPMPTRRSGLGVVAIDELIYAVGGSVPGDVSSGVLEVYDPSANEWTTGFAPMPTPRQHLMAVASNGKLYAIGGSNGPNNTNPLGTLEVFDPLTNSWASLAPMPTPQHFGAAGVIGDTIIVTGTGGTQKYSITNDTWSAGVPLPGGGGAIAGGATNDGFFVFGGQNGNGLRSDTLVYYLQTPQRPEGWATLGAMPTPRTELAAAVVGDVVYGIGGSTGGAPPQAGLPTLTALSTPPPGNLQTGFGGTSNDPQVQWSSSNTAVATINSFGSAQAVATGQTTIIAAAGTITCAATNSCATLTVTNAPPTVQITGGPFSRNEGQDVFINANSFDPDNDPLTRQWTIVSGPGQFVGSTTGSGATFRNNDGPGFTTIRLTVTDSFGASASSTTTVQINNVAPQVQIFGGDPLMAIEGQTLNASGNFMDPGADAWSATVDYGDGTPVQPLPAPNKQFQLSHTYAISGTYFIRVTVSDDDLGAGSQTREVAVNPTSTPPPFSQTPATPAGACVCTPAVNLARPNAQHQWFVKADNSGQLTVTLVASAVIPSGQTVMARVWDGDTMVAELAASYPAGSDDEAEFRDSETIAAEPGRIYRVQTAAPGFQFARYWLRFDGGVVAGINGPTFSNVYGGSATWLLNADASDTLSMRLFTQGIAEFQGAMPRTIAYQWIAPNGDSAPIQTFEVVVPASPQFLDTAIPVPANVVPGIWRLRLSADFDYRLEKQSGADRGLYLDHRSGGRSSMTVHLVDQHGVPLTETVNVRVSFGKSFDLAVENGLLHVPVVDAFVYHFDVTPPAGLIASPATFDLTVLCDQPAETTVVIAPPEPPSLSVALSPDNLWPSNNSLVDVTATIAATSPYGNPLTIELVSITSNDGSDAGDIANAAIGTDDRAFQLRAKRLRGYAERIYTVTYRVTDTGTGLSATAFAAATVPHDRRQ